MIDLSQLTEDQINELELQIQNHNKEKTKMTETEQLTLLLKVLKEYAEAKHCYERDKFYDVYDERELGETVEHAEEYAQIHFARTLLEQIGVEYENPSMNQEK